MKRINVDIDENIWRRIGIRAAVKEKTKTEMVNEALEYYLDNTKDDLKEID
jgi:hypothetical protein